VQAYALARLEVTAPPARPVPPAPVAAPAGNAPSPELAYAGVETGVGGDDRKGWGIIEID
jgi:hypothetical protein